MSQVYRFKNKKWKGEYNFKDFLKEDKKKFKKKLERERKSNKA